MHPTLFRNADSSNVAVIMDGTGESVTFGDLEGRSLQLAKVLDEAGLKEGDVVALLSDNDVRCFEVYWAAVRSGL